MQRSVLSKILEVSRCPECQRYPNRRLRILQYLTSTCYRRRLSQFSLMSSRCTSTLSQNVTGSPDRRSTLKTHRYNRCLVDSSLLSSHQKTLDWALKNIIYEDDLFVALNKVSGMPVFRSRENSKLVDRFGVNEDDLVTLSDILPELQSHFSCPELKVAVPISSLHSGVVVFTKSSDGKNFLKKCQRIADAQKLPCISNLVINVAMSPSSSLPPETCYFRLSKENDIRPTVLVTKPSRQARLQDDILSVSFSTDVLARDHHLGIQLSRVTVNKEKWDCVQAYMYHKMCPVLGDHEYGRLIQTILGVPVLVEPSLVTKKYQVVPDRILHALRLKKEDISRLPFYLHRHTLKLQDHPSKPNKVINITAPIPSYFSAALECLNLSDSNLLQLN